jgi:hypothetical protein
VFWLRAELGNGGAGSIRWPERGIYRRPRWCSPARYFRHEPDLFRQQLRSRGLPLPRRGRVHRCRGGPRRLVASSSPAASWFGSALALLALTREAAGRLATGLFVGEVSACLAAWVRVLLRWSWPSLRRVASRSAGALMAWSPRTPGAWACRASGVDGRWDWAARRSAGYCVLGHGVDLAQSGGSSWGR